MAETQHRPLRILMLGTVNSPHVEQVTLEMLAHGHTVSLVGHLGSDQPPTMLDEGIPVTVLPPRKRPFGIVARLRQLRGLIRESAPDVVHVHYLSRLGLAAQLAARVPLVATAFGSDVLRAAGIERWAVSLLARRADALTADSLFLRDRLVEIGAKPDRIAILGNGVDLEAFSPAEDRAAVRKQLGLGPGPMILSARAAKPLYNLDKIVDAFARVARRHSTIVLVVKHFGGEPPRLPSTPVADRIRLVGPVSRDEMAAYYRAADVCVSIPSSDSSPRTVWEAMACGCPCVLSDLPWAKERIEPGKDALVVPIDPDAVEAAIERILTEPRLAAQLSERGRSLVERHEDTRAEMNRLEALYRELASRR